MKLPGVRDAIFSLKTFAAAMLALFVAFSLDLPRPSWAMLTVFIVAQPFSGMVRSKAAYRVAGTLTGAIFAVLAVPNLVTAPELLSLALAAWLGLCLYASLIDRTPRAYAFMLAGYTACIVGLPSVGAPAEIFTTALARSEEIVLGILCATLVDMLILPRRVGEMLGSRLDAWLLDAAAWAGSILTSAQPAAEADPQRLIGDVMGIEALRVHAIYDTPSLRLAGTRIVELQRRMQMLFSLLLAIEDHLLVLRSEKPGTAGLEPTLEGMAVWLKAPDAARAAGLAGELDRHRPEAAGWGDLVLANLLARLRDLLRVWQECGELRAGIEAGTPWPGPSEPLALHRDHLMAGLSGFAAALSLLLACALWIGTAWPEGATAATLAAVLACLFAAADDPAPFALSFLWCTLGAAIVGGVYLFAVLPAVDGFAGLAAVLAVFYLPVVALMPNPAYFPYALPVVINSAAFLGLQRGYTLDPAAYLNGALAQLVGMGLTVLVLRLVRSAGAVRRLVLAMQGDLARLARGDPALRRERFEARAFDRLNALIPRLRGLAGEGVLDPLKASLADLRSGLNLFHLREAATLPGEAAGPIRSLLGELTDFFRDREPARPAPDPALLGRLDDALRKLSAASPADDPGLLAVVGLRRALVPEAPSPRLAETPA